MKMVVSDECRNGWLYKLTPQERADIYILRAIRKRIVSLTKDQIESFLAGVDAIKSTKKELLNKRTHSRWENHALEWDPYQWKDKTCVLCVIKRRAQEGDPQFFDSELQAKTKLQVVSRKKGPNMTLSVERRVKENG